MWKAYQQQLLGSNQTTNCLEIVKDQHQITRKGKEEKTLKTTAIVSTRYVQKNLDIENLKRKRYWSPFL